MADYPTGPLSYNDIEHYLTAANDIRQQIIDKCREYDLWRGDETTYSCKLSEVSSYIGLRASYTVTFVPGEGATCPETTRQVKDGNAIGDLPTAVKSEYAHLGWFTSPTGGTQYSASTIVTGNVTLYAQYMHSIIELARVGDVKIESGMVATNFSQPNYLTAIAADILNFADGLELVFRAKTTNSSASQTLFSMTDVSDFEFGAKNARFKWKLVESEEAQLGQNSCLNSWYYWQIAKQTDSQYACNIADSTSTSEEPTFVQDYPSSGTITLSRSIAGHIMIGINSSTIQSAQERWLGDVDLLNSYIKVNGQKITFKVKCNATFNANGHGTAPASQSAYYGSTISKPTDPTNPTGYSFAGWYKESDCINVWNFETDVLDGDTALYAKWNTNTYVITLKTNGGTING